MFAETKIKIFGFWILFNFWLERAILPEQKKSLSGVGFRVNAKNRFHKSVNFGNSIIPITMLTPNLAWIERRRFLAKINHFCFHNLGNANCATQVKLFGLDFEYPYIGIECYGRTHFWPLLKLFPY